MRTDALKVLRECPDSAPVPGLPGDDDWNPSAPLPVLGNLLADEVYVDPYKKG